MALSVRVVILGAGGHASDVLGLVEALRNSGHDLTCAGVVGAELPDASRFAGRDAPYLGPVERLDPTRSDIAADAYLCGAGYPGGRAALAAAAARLDLPPAPPLVHPSGVVGVDVRLSPGVIVLGLVQLSAGVRVGALSLVSYGCLVGHDCTVGANTSLMPGAVISGDVRLGDDVLVGTNATILQGLRIGDGAVVGAGAVVTHDVAPGMTVVGNPARPVPNPS